MEANSRLEEGIRQSSVRRVRSALSKGADPNVRFGAEGRSALAWAVLVGGAAIVFALLEAGARVSEEDGETTSLHEAARSGNTDILRALLATAGKRHVNRYDGDGCTPLMIAVEAGNVQAVRLLLEAGARVNAQRDVNSGCALRVAVASGTLEMVRMLAQAGADPHQIGRLMLSPLDRARQRTTPEGRMIAAFLTRHAESLANAHPHPRKPKPRHDANRRRIKQLSGRKR
jgi:ankyrin repeat protein